MKNNWRNSPLARFFGFIAIGLIAGGVLLFLGSHSLNFFQFTFTEDDAIYAWLGLLLTSGGVIGWLVVFETLAKGAIQKGVALTLMVVGLFGELATAVFDMRYSATYQSFTFSEAELGNMTMLIGVLGALTGLGLIAFFSGDHIIQALRDDDGDGIPNYRDPVDNRKNKGSNNPQPTNHTIDDYLEKIGMDYPSAQAHWRGKEYKDFAADTNTKFDRISGGNMRAIYGELVGNPPVAARNNGKNP